jgi:hypothetical protein
MQQPVEQALVHIVTAAMPSLEHVPPAYHGELETMEALSDAELWREVESQIPVAQQRQLTQLQRKHQRGAMTDRERQTLARLRMELDRMMLRRSYCGWRASPAMSLRGCGCRRVTPRLAAVSACSTPASSGGMRTSAGVRRAPRSSG